jgi:hypothetical protein
MCLFGALTWINIVCTFAGQTGCDLIMCSSKVLCECLATEMVTGQLALAWLLTNSCLPRYRSLVPPVCTMPRLY